jgi:glutaredoxin-dependent peroxiredoxin
VQSRLAEIQQAGHVFGISVDSPFSQAKWSEQEKYTVPMLSDLGKEVVQAYGAFYPDLRGMKGVGKRAAFLIDKSGKLVKAEIKEVASELPDMDGFINELKALA